MRLNATSVRPGHREHSVGNWSLGDERLQQVQGRRKEEAAGDRPTEIEQAIVVARRTANEHILQHLFDRARRARIADEIGPELSARNVTKRHIVAEDLDLFAVLLEDR